MRFLLDDTTINKKIKKGDVEVTKTFKYKCLEAEDIKITVKGELTAEEYGFPTKINDLVEIKVTGQNVQGRLK